ncbi:MAG: hypothetical protein RLZZ584_2991 [Pseudomonadota bacterium]
MTANAFHNIARIEASLWDAADQLRANSKLTSSEYCMPVLGVIFLRHASNRYLTALRAIETEQRDGRMPVRPLGKADFHKRRALMLPEAARYEHLLALPSGSALGAALVNAMNAVEASFEPLAGTLPRDYERFDSKLLEDLLKTFDTEELRTATGDVFGRIYEYFLMKFAMQGAQDNGEFFTPPSLVQTLVNVIEPDRGVVADLACGSGGMFVQSSHFIEQEGLDTMQRVTFYGQEKTPSTIRLAKMNLAVHGLQGEIADANTFYDDPHRLPNGKPLWGNCDFIMANPPFNVDKVDAGRVQSDRRLPFGLPGVNKDKHVSNGNYLWISYFHSYLSPRGRAGFVMSSQASSAGHGEKEVRRKLVETGDVDVMIAIRSNFFYTRTVPCELWHFDRNKPAERKRRVLMLDARNVYRKVTRKIYDFAPEQLANLTAIVWLYRGQQQRFLGLVQGYVQRLVDDAAAIAPALARVETSLAAHRLALDGFVENLVEMTLAVHEREPLVAALAEWASAEAAYVTDRKLLVDGITAWCAPFKAALPATNEAQRSAGADFVTLSDRSRGLVKQVDLLYKLAARAGQLAHALAADDTIIDHFDRRAASKLLKQVDEDRHLAVEQLKAATYVYRQIDWLQQRFPKAEMCDVAGLCKVVDLADIEAADWSLTPGRYVGVAPAEVDADFDFEQTLRDIHLELADLNREAGELALKVQANFEELM